MPNEGNPIWHDGFNKGYAHGIQKGREEGTRLAVELADLLLEPANDTRLDELYGSVAMKEKARAIKKLAEGE